MTFPSTIDKSQYSRKQTLDSHSAMARALANHLRELDVRDFTGIPKPFGKVYEAWPDPEDAYVAPCTATVMPVPYTYEASQLTPDLLLDTWEPRGFSGLGLYKIAEVVEDFEIRIRCPSAEERRMFMAAIETAWVTDGLLMEEPGARYGIVIPMPEYWNIPVVFAQKSVRMLDDEDRAMREHREASIIVTGQASQVKLGPVQPMKLTIKQSVIPASEDF